jgi:glycosyltransferase involved in cell wall biosynthesis
VIEQETGQANAPTVSVVMPAYNAMEYIGDAVGSVLDQSYRDFELIVVDDGSTDDTRRILREYGSRIRVLEMGHHGRPSAPRNRGIREARGRYIAFFDADDIMHSRQLENSVAILEHDCQVALCFSNFVLMRAGRELSRPWFEKGNVRDVIDRIPVRSIGNGSFICNRPIYNEILANNFVHTSTVMVRRADLLEVGLFDETLRRADDWDLWLRFARSGRVFGFCTDVMSYYRIRPTSVSRDNRNAGSYIGLLERLHAQDPDRSNRRVISHRLAVTCLGCGLLEKEATSYGEALKYFWKAFCCGTMRTRVSALYAACKLPIFMICGPRIGRPRTRQRSGRKDSAK